MSNKNICNGMKAVLFLIVIGFSSFTWAANLYVDGTNTCTNNAPCTSTTISAAVLLANAGDVIYIYPGTYTEVVNLLTMNTTGTIQLISVNSSGTPTAGTVTISSAASAPLSCDGSFTGNITVNGINVEYTGAASGNDNNSGMNFEGITGDISLIDMQASSANGWDGFGIYSITGNVSFEGCTANSCYDDGISTDGITGTVTANNCSASSNGDNGISFRNSGNNVTVTNCTATGNSDDGIEVYNVTGTVQVTDCTSQTNEDDGFDLENITGDLSLTRCTAQNNDAPGSGDNDEDGFELTVTGSITVDNCTATGNNQEGIDAELCTGNFSVTNSTASSNGGEGIDTDIVGVNISITNSSIMNNTASGISLAEVQLPSGTIEISCCDITGNGTGVEMNQTKTVDADYNWWGNATGPTHPNNPGGSGDSVVDSANTGSGTVTYDPFLTGTVASTNCQITQGDEIPVTNPLGMTLLILIMASLGWRYLGNSLKAS